MSDMIGLRSTTTLEELTETRTAELLVAVFEPPEPPETPESVEPPEQPDSPVSDQESSTDTDSDATAQPAFNEETASDGLWSDK